MSEQLPSYSYQVCRGYQVSAHPWVRVPLHPSNDALLGADHVLGLVGGPAPTLGLVVQPQLFSWKTANKT